MSTQVGSYIATSIADAGTVTADSELGDFVAINLQSAAADLAWRGNTDAVIQIDLAESALIDFMALCLHNLQPTAVITIELFENRANPAVLSETRLVGDALLGVNTGPFNRFGWNGVDDNQRAEYANFITSFAVTRAQFIDITLQDSGNADGYIEVRRLKLGQLVRPGDSFNWGYQFGFVTGKGYRAGSVTWAWNSNDEMVAINELIHSHGADPDKLARTRAGELLGFDDDILWIGYPEESGLRQYQHIALVALVQAEAPFKPNIAQGVATLNIEEVYFGIIRS